MKTILLACCLTIFFASCKGPANPPTETLDGMFAAMKSGNIEEMKNYITKSDVNLLDAAEKILASVDSAAVKKIKTRITEELKAHTNDIQYRFKEQKIDGDHATVETEITVKDPDSAGVVKTSTHNFELVKEDNTWKIALTKPGNEMFNSMKGNMGTRDRGLKDGIERLKQMDPDSLKMIIKKGAQALDSMDNKKE